MSQEVMGQMSDVIRRLVLLYMKPDEDDRLYRSKCIQRANNHAHSGNPYGWDPPTVLLYRELPGKYHYCLAVGSTWLSAQAKPKGADHACTPYILVDYHRID
jgi:hypothetical protein